MREISLFIRWRVPHRGTDEKEEADTRSDLLQDTGVVP